jgi:ubiquitin conjugation factor E4 B
VLTSALRRDPNGNHDSLVPYLLRNHDNEDGLCLDFFTEAVSRISDDDTIAPLFTDAMVTMSEQVAKMTMNDDYKPYINVRPGQSPPI